MRLNEKIRSIRLKTQIYTDAIISEKGHFFE